MKRVGLIMGDEPLVESALVERLSTEPAIEVDRVLIGGTAERPIGHHDVIFDRMSPLVPHYQSFLRVAALAGANVVNDPFALTDDKFFALALAARLGLQVPRAVLLPQKAYGAGVDPSRSLGNLEFPLQWDDIGHYVGFPGELRSARRHGPPSRAVSDVGGLLHAFDQTWDQPTFVQAAVDGVRARLCCIAVADAAVLVELDPPGVRAIPAELLDAAKEAAIAITRALGLDINAVELAITDDGVWVTEPLEPLPRLAPHTLGAEAFDRVMDWVAGLLVSRAWAPERTVDRQPLAAFLARR